MRPNILSYFTDQQRADACGCFGRPLDACGFPGGIYPPIKG